VSTKNAKEGTQYSLCSYTLTLLVDSDCGRFRDSECHASADLVHHHDLFHPRIAHGDPEDNYLRGKMQTEEGDTVQLGSPSLYSERVTRVAQTKKRENQEFELRSLTDGPIEKGINPDVPCEGCPTDQRSKRTAQPNPWEGMALHFS
jgi:hypothetical protein